jgi:hypothetical protein
LDLKRAVVRVAGRFADNPALHLQGECNEASERVVERPA